MVPTLIKYDQNAYNAMIGYANKDLALYNGLIVQITALTPNIPVTLDVLKTLWADPTAYLFGLLTQGQSMTFLGLPVSFKKALDFVEMPDNYSQLITYVNQLKAGFTANSVYGYQTDRSFMNRLSFDDTTLANGVLSLSAVYLDFCTQHNSVFTSTDKGNQILDVMTRFTGVFNEMLALGVTVYDVKGLGNVGINGIQNKAVQYDPLIVKRLERELK